MSFGGGPSLGGGLMVSGSGGGAGGSTGYVDPQAPGLSCSGDPGGSGPGGSCTNNGGRPGGSCTVGGGGGMRPGSSGGSRQIVPLSANSGSASGSSGCGSGAFSGGGGSPSSDGSYVPLTIRTGPVDGSGWWARHDQPPGPRVFLPLNLGGSSCASPPDSGTSPEPVPGPGSPFSEGVQILSTGSCGPFLVGGLPITCAETGVTLNSVCSSTVFFNHTSLGPKTYHSAGGAVANCGGRGTAHSGGMATGTGQSAAVGISSACTP